MNYHKLGKSELMVSGLGFGCMSLHKDTIDNQNLISKAIQLGVNFFDTADLYDKGTNEILVGKALKAYRKDVIIATKVGNEWRKDGSGWDWNPTKTYIVAQVESSLQRLQTDYIDLYQLHGGTIDDPIDETIEAFEILQKEGKIRHYGISSIRPNVIREYVKRSNIVSVMMQYSLLDRRPEESCLDYLHEHDISVLTRGGLAQGLLIDKPVKTYLNYTEAEVKNAANVIRETSIASGINQAQVALNYVFHHPAVASAITGVRTQEQLEELIPEGDIKLSDDTILKLKSSIKANFYDQHR